MVVVLLTKVCCSCCELVIVVCVLLRVPALEGLSGVVAAAKLVLLLVFERLEFVVLELEFELLEEELPPHRAFVTRSITEVLPVEEDVDEDEVVEFVELELFEEEEDDEPPPPPPAGLFVLFELLLLLLLLLP